MPAITYTPSQRKAIEYGGGSLLLSAAAGSGKTAALSARITHLVGSGTTPLSRMLIVTFTRAAASEMRARIGKALGAAMEEIRTKAGDGGSLSPDDEARLTRLGDALVELPSAEITTIHAFLFHVLKPYFPTLGLPHDARIGDEEDMKALLADVMRDTVDDFFDGVVTTGEDASPFTELADLIGQVRDTGAIDAELLWLAGELRQRGGNGETLRRFARILHGAAEGEETLFDTPWGRTVARSVGDFLTHYGEIFRKSAEDFALLPKAQEKYGAALAYHRQWLAEASAELREKRYGALGIRFREYAPPRLGSLKPQDATEETDTFRFFRDEMKKEITALGGKFFAGDENEFRESARRTAGILRTAAAVLDECFARFSAKKRERALLDYNDLEEFGISLLCGADGEPTSAARELGARYGAIFIDEYQDTGGVQDAIFRAIAKDVPRFMVGDIKQSIYRFRGADPTVFSSYRRAWDSIAPGDADHPFAQDEGVSLFLSENFRCADPVVRFVNLVSGAVFPHSEIPYEAEDALIYAKNGGVAGENEIPTELCLIDKKQWSESDDEGGDEDPEAAYVAGRIADLLGRYREDGGILTPSDVAILLRSPGTNGAAFREALAKYGIAASLKTAEPLGDSPAVMLLLSLLRFADNPLRDVDAAAALRSPLFGMDLGDLLRLRDAAGDEPLYFGLLQCASGEWDGGEGRLRAKCETAAAWVRRMKTIARGMTSDKFMEYLLRDGDLTALDGIRGNGREQDAIARLMSLARTWESGAGGGVGGLSGFLEYAEQTLDSAESGITPTGENAVSIVSIHASKGLEYPVCFLCGCGKRRNATDEARTMLYDGELGLGMYLPAGGGLARCDTFLRRAISEKIRRDSVEEEMRMLYVALTRAREHLIVTGKVADAEAYLKKMKRYARFPSRHRVLSVSTYLDWLTEAALGASNEPWLTLTVVGAESSVQTETAGVLPQTDEETVGERCAVLRGQLTAGYRWAHLSKIASKLTVSRLHPEILDEDGLAEVLAESVRETPAADEPDFDDTPAEIPPETKKSPLLRPKFLTGDDGGTGAERGSATHVFLQFADYSALRQNGVTAEMERLVNARFMSRNMASLIRTRQIERFRESGLMDLLLRSPMVKREFRFNVQMDAADFTGDAELAEILRRDGEKITVQGVVDCVFRHPDTGKLILVDYKTDALPPEAWKTPAVGGDILLARHRNQLTYYGRICAELFEESIAGVWIYSTVLGRVFPVEREE